MRKTVTIAAIAAALGTIAMAASTAAQAQYYGSYLNQPRGYGTPSYAPPPPPPADIPPRPRVVVTPPSYGYGSGAYADNWTGAASATGHGEALMRVVISKRVCDFVAAGIPAQQACEAAMHVLTERVQGECGVIAIDARGGIGAAHNTAAMPRAYATGNERVESSY